MIKVNFSLNIISQLITLITILILTPEIIKKNGLEGYGNFLPYVLLIHVCLLLNPMISTFLKLLKLRKDSDINTLNIYILLISLAIYALNIKVESDYLSLTLIVICLISYFIQSSIYIEKNQSGLVTLYPPIIILVIHLYYLYNTSVNLININSQIVFFITILYGIKNIRVEKYKIDLKVIKYIIYRSKQTCFLSLVTLLNTNLDKIIFPIILDPINLALYNVLIILPSRLVSFYSIITNILYKKFFFGKEKNETIRLYYRYNLYLMLPSVFILLIFREEIFLHFLIDNTSEFIFLYNFVIIISILQSYNFLSYIVLSSENDLFYYSWVNAFSGCVQLIFILFFYYQNIINIELILFSIFLSRIIEILNIGRLKKNGNKTVYIETMKFLLILIFFQVLIYVFEEY